jgi:hypothetical protein
MVEWAQAIAVQPGLNPATETVLAAEQGLVLGWASKTTACSAAAEALAARKPRYIARKPRWPAFRLNLRPSIEPEEGKA